MLKVQKKEKQNQAIIGCELFTFFSPEHWLVKLLSYIPFYSPPFFSFYASLWSSSLIFSPLSLKSQNHVQDEVRQQEQAQLRGSEKVPQFYPFLHFSSLCPSTPGPKSSAYKEIRYFQCDFMKIVPFLQSICVKNYFAFLLKLFLTLSLDSLLSYGSIFNCISALCIQYIVIEFLLYKSVVINDHHGERRAGHTSWFHQCMQQTQEPLWLLPSDFLLTFLC